MDSAATVRSLNGRLARLSRSWETVERAAWARRLVTAAALSLPLAAAAVVYGQFLNVWFAADDVDWLQVAANPDFLDFVKGAFTLPDGPTGYWRPLIDLYFFSMLRVFHLEATAYHVVSLLVHGATAACTVLIVRRLSRSLTAGAVAGLLFAVAPTYAVAVTWISAATELFSVFFSIAAVLLFLRYLDGEGRAGTLLVGTFAFAGALLSKEASVSVPAIMAVVGLAARPPRDLYEARRFLLGLLPFAAVDGAFVLLQFSQVYFAPSTGNYQVDYRVFERLGDRLRWLSLPYRTSSGSWVTPAQWAVLSSFSLAAGIALFRRSWALPALFASTVLALIPSSFLTPEVFSPRWVYLATVTWAGFVGVLIMMFVRWLSMRHILLGAAALPTVLAGLAIAFVPKTIDAQRWLPGYADQLLEIRHEFRTECPVLERGGKVFLFRLPIRGDSYVAPAFVHLLYPEATVVPVRPGLAPPQEQDCVLQYGAGAYHATPGDAPAAADHWVFAASAPCPDAVPWETAGLNVGTSKTIRAPLVGTRISPNGQQAVLEVGAPGKLLARITRPDAKDAWLVYREVEFGTMLCITGFIHPSRGVLLIDVASPRSIVFESP